MMWILLAPAFAGDVQCLATRDADALGFKVEIEGVTQGAFLVPAPDGKARLTASGQTWVLPSTGEGRYASKQAKLSLHDCSSTSDGYVCRRAELVVDGTRTKGRLQTWAMPCVPFGGG